MLKSFELIVSVSLIYLAFMSTISLSNVTDPSTSEEIETSYCQEEIYNSKNFDSNNGIDYGEFKFASSRATKSGILSHVACPFGFRNEGFEPIYSSEILNGSAIEMQNDKEAQSGVKRFCILKQNENGIFSPQWEPAQEEIKINYCRMSGGYSLEKDVHQQILSGSTITPLNFKQALGMINGLVYYAMTDYSCAQTLIDSIGNLLSAELHENGSFPAEAVTLFKLLETYATEANLQPGYRVQVANSRIAVQTALFPYNEKIGIKNALDYSSQVGNVKINLPAEAIKRSLEQRPGQPRLKITSFSEELFFHWNDSSKEISPESSASDKNNVTDIIGNWRVFSVDLVGVKIYNLTSEFEYIFFVDKDETNKYQWNCVYWNEKSKTWSSEGMRSIPMDNSIICKSTHLTAFSVLIDPLPLPFPGSDYAPINNSVHAHILSILSSIGSAISIIGLAGTVLTYGLFRVLRKERSNRILLNLSFSLLFLHLFSISSSKDLWDYKCFVPSILLQYFLHTSLSWMLMEAYHMHQLLISVFVKPESRFIAKRSLVAWGIPLVIVVICGAVQPEVYSTGRNDLCVIAAHLNLPLYYIAYLTPAILILFVNFCVFCRIINVLYKQTVRQRKQNHVGKVAGSQNGTQNLDKKDWNQTIAENMRTKTRYIMLSPTQIKGALTVMILVGVGWIIGFFAIGPFEIFFKYLFCICNAGQGAMIFIFRVILHPQACRQWRKALLGLNFDSTEVSTTSTTTFSNKDIKKSSFSASPTFISASNSVENSLTPSNPVAQDLANKLAFMRAALDGHSSSEVL